MVPKLSGTARLAVFGRSKEGMGEGVGGNDRKHQNQLSDKKCLEELGMWSETYKFGNHCTGRTPNTKSQPKTACLRWGSTMSAWNVIYQIYKTSIKNVFLFTRN